MPEQFDQQQQQQQQPAQQQAPEQQASEQQQQQPPAPPLPELLQQQQPPAPSIQQGQVYQQQQVQQPDAGYQQFAQQLKQYLGMTPDDIKAIGTFYQEQQRQNAINALKSEWGQNYDYMYNQVQQRLAAMPAQQQAQFNNLEGAKLIGQAILAEQYRQQMSVPNAGVPQFQNSVPSMGPAKQYAFKRSEIMKMPRSEYSERVNEITAAYQNGLVDLNG